MSHRPINIFKFLLLLIKISNFLFTIIIVDAYTTMAGKTWYVLRRVLRRAMRLGAAALSKKGNFPNIKTISNKNTVSPLLSPSSAATPIKAPTMLPIMPH